MASDCLFVTGGTGFVGRHLVKALCARGKRVRAVIRPGKEKFFEEQGLSVETILTEDLFAESSAWWKEAYQEVDTVIHCAWFAKVGEYRS
ncbi:MAG: NAD-dependent epimerase/dehydratase family protein, partial [Holosporales bacterium]|nr:NAD-dependent epimerase/dehydratase family protein [Holosporales bacterium]